MKPSPMTDAEIDALIETIRVKIEADGVRATDLAAAAGISAGYVSQIINRSRDDRRRNPGPVLVLAHALGLVTIEEDTSRRN